MTRTNLGRFHVQKANGLNRKVIWHRQSKVRKGRPWKILEEGRKKTGYLPNRDKLHLSVTLSLQNIHFSGSNKIAQNKAGNQISY